MKVKVIDVTGARDLAIGKVYNVIEQKANGNFIITNEAGKDVSFKASRFEVVRGVPVSFTFEVSADVAEKLNDILSNEDLSLADFITSTVEDYDR